MIGREGRVVQATVNHQIFEKQKVNGGGLMRYNMSLLVIASHRLSIGLADGRGEIIILEISMISHLNFLLFFYSLLYHHINYLYHNDLVFWLSSISRFIFLQRYYKNIEVVNVHHSFLEKVALVYHYLW